MYKTGPLYQVLTATFRLNDVQRVVAYGLLSNSMRMMVGATSVIFLMSRGVTLGELGLLKGLQAGLILALDIPLGWVADKWGRRRVITLATIATAIWLGLSALAEHTPSPISIFYVAEGFSALGIAAFNGAYSAVLLSTYETSTGRRDFENVLGWYGKWQFGLMAVTATIGAAMGGHASTTVWWAAAGGTALLALAARHLLPADMSTPAKDAPRLWRDIVLVAKPLFSLAGLKWVAAAYVCLMLAYQVLLQFWQPVVAMSALAERAGWTYGVAFVLFLLAQSGASEYARRGVSYQMLVTVGAFGLLGLGLVLVPGADNNYVCLLLGISTAFFAFKLIVIALLANVQRALPSRLWATAESSLSSVMRMLFIIALPLVGFTGSSGSPLSIVVTVLALLFAGLCCTGLAHQKGTIKHA